MNILNDECRKVLYDDETEERLHLGAIQALSIRIGLSMDKVERLYEIVLNRFKREAKIRDYLPILVSRRVQYLLDKRRVDRRTNCTIPGGEPDKCAF